MKRSGLLLVLSFLGIAAAHDGDPLHNRADEVIAKYTAALKEDPDDLHALSERALAYLKQEEYESALADIDKAVQLEPESEGYRMTRAFTRLKLADWKGALADLGPLCAAGTKVPGAWFYRGELRFLQGDLKGARADLDQGHAEVAKLTKKPYLHGLVARARVLAAQGDAKGALADLTRALDSDPRLEEALVERATLLAPTDWDAAKKDIDTASELYKTSAVTLATQARLQFQRNGIVAETYTKAIEAYQRDSKFARSASRKAELLVAAARLRADLGDVWPALDLLEDALQIAPGRLDLNRLRVKLLEHADGVKPATLERARKGLADAEAKYGVAPVGSG